MDQKAADELFCRQRHGFIAARPLDAAILEGEGHAFLIAVLHTWGSAMTHHPRVHMIVPGGGISADGERWVGCRRGFMLPVPVLSPLFRRLMLEKIAAAHKAGKLKFFGEHANLADEAAFKAYLAPLKTIDWFVYSKRPLSGPKAVLAYLARYTHRVAISNRRLVAAWPL